MNEDTPNKYNLVVSLSFEDPSDEEAIKKAKDIIFLQLQALVHSDAKVTLVRNGDRAALNLLLPKLSGRFGEHYQGRKATLDEIR